VPQNLGQALATDLYQLTMAAGYFHRGRAEHRATCEMFVRRLPKARRFLVALGIEDAVEHALRMRFSEDDLAFLAELPALRDAMTPDFIGYLRDFRFRGDVWAVDEGAVVFEREPLVRVEASIIEAQILETFLLSAINHATTIGSKAARVLLAAEGRGVVEFGTRRTHPESALDAARAAYAVGFAGTSNVEAGRRFGIPVTGTAAHMWTMAHATEREAFEGYFSVFPNSSILLIDTYDTPRGALRAAELVRDKLKGVRIDSGDLGAMSREVRATLDANGAPQAKIVASGDLNEHSIAALVAEGAPIDTFGVGTELVCSVDAPALSGVYKLVELDDGSGPRPIAKFSEGKGTLPGPQQVHRVRAASGQPLRDVIALADEAAPTAPEGGSTAPLLSVAIRSGTRVRDRAAMGDVRARVASELESLPASLRALAVDPGAPRYAIEVSAPLASLVDEVRTRVVEAG